MKEFDTYILDRWFWKCIEHGGVDEFTVDVFKGWLEENGIDVEPEDEDDRLEIFELLMSSELEEAVNKIEDWKTNEYAIKLLEMEAIYLTSKTCKIADSLMTQLNNIKVPEELK